MADLYDFALAAHDAGLSVIPITANGSKAPAIAWKEYQEHRASEDQLQAWFGIDCTYDGFAVICGAVSGGLEMLELEGRAVDRGMLEQIEEAAAGAGLLDVLDAISDGYRETTPSGGIHWLYRCEETEGNQKLAVDAIRECLLETRGDGGYVIVAPSGGRTHPSGRSWELDSGGFDSIATITPQQRRELLTLFRSFDETPPMPFDGWEKGRKRSDGHSPGDEFNAATTWSDILIPEGWTAVGVVGERTNWRRPGKDSGISATTNYLGSDVLYVYSTSTRFQAERSYDRFGAYAVLKHGGDLHTAAEALAREGYGTAPELVLIKQQEQERHLTLVKEDAPDVDLTVADADEDDEDGGNVLAPFQMTDMGNSSRFVAAHGSGMRYVPEWGRWLVWTDTHWQEDNTGEPLRRGRSVVEGILSEAAVAESKSQERELVKHYRRSQSVGRLKAMVELAQSEAGIPVHSTELDTDPYALCVANGTVDLRTGALRSHRQSDLITRVVPVAYKPGAAAATWLRFMADILPDPDLRAWLQRAIGYSLTGDVSEHVFFFPYGGGANGKSTFLGALASLLGDYATLIPAGLLVNSGHEQHPTAIAGLEGKRLAIAAESEQNKQLAEGLVKSLTGGDRITARRMRQDFYEFNPTHKLWLHANHKPRIGGTDEGIWRRMRLVPFTVTIPAHLRDNELPRKLEEEHEGILSWAIEGAIQWSQYGLGPCATVDSATDVYRFAEDHVGRFLEECCEIEPGKQVAAGRLRDAYKAWCRAVGEKERAAKTITPEFEERGFIHRRSQKRFWEGLDLNPEYATIVDRMDR